MNKRCIRIGTRSSPLALWQTRHVQDSIKRLGHETTIVTIKSEGDNNLGLPLYEMGVVGIFTKALDIAILQNKIDLAVHSMKDVPTQLPTGLVQSAVLPRGQVGDLLIHKKEYNPIDDCIIATGSLRRQAQWLRKYPHHQVENLRGNVQSRLEKLESQVHWSGAIFATVGLERMNIKPSHLLPLDWMIPAPAQGAIVVCSREDDEYCQQTLTSLNHLPTEICTTIERDFLRTLEGGCTAPIGAWARVIDDNIHFEGIILLEDGSESIDISEKCPFNASKNMGEIWANKVLNMGGKTIIQSLR